MAIAETKQTANDGVTSQWPELCRRIAKRADRRNLSVLWPEVGKSGRTLLWGIEAAFGEVRPTVRVLAELAGKQRLKESETLVASAEQFLDTIGRTPLDREQIPEALCWAYAMPTLATHCQHLLGEQLWWSLLEELQSLHRAASSELAPTAPERLWLAGEMGAILGWQLADLPSCEALQKPSLTAIADWFAASGDSIVEAIKDRGRYARLVLASAVRSRRLSAHMKARLGIRRSGAAVDLAAWVVAMTRKSGTQMLGPENPCREDLGPKGLLEIAAGELGGTTLQTAVQASLGKIKGEHGLSWQVVLPETGWFDEEAKLAVMLPDWDIRRGRIAVDYSGDQFLLEISGGRRPLIHGAWTNELKVDGKTLVPQGHWTDLCSYHDDEVHYLEVERKYSGGVKVQRQILLLRDDLCFLLAEAVLGPDGCKIQHRSRLSLPDSLYVEEEQETTEFWIRDDRHRAIVLPIAIGEWRVGPSLGVVTFSDSNTRTSGHRKRASAVESATSIATQGLYVQCEKSGTSNLFSPLWFDLSRTRMQKDRTWRHLAVAEKLRLVEPNEAVAYRIHIGDEQWVLYRSLKGPANRTFIGKNLISEFFCGRFDAEEGTIEELLAVDEQPE